MKPDFGLLFLRVSIGAMMILGHGVGKLQSLLAGNGAFPDPLGIGSTPSLVLAVVGELVAPALVVLGWKTRWAAIPPAITMLVAAFVFHGNDPWSNKELPLLFAVPFLTLVFTGGGRYALDAMLARRRRR